MLLVFLHVCVCVCVLQVPSKVLVACSRLLAERFSTVHKLIAVRAASTVLRLAFIAPNSSSSSSSSSGINASLRQQLEPSGLLQQLPELLTTAAQQLEVEGPAAAAAAGETCAYNDGSSCGSTESQLTLSLDLASDAYHLLRGVNAVTPGLLLYTPVGHACVLSLARIAINTLRALGSVFAADSTPSNRQRRWLLDGIKAILMVVAAVLDWTTDTDASGGSSRNGSGGSGGGVGGSSSSSSTPPGGDDWLQSPYPLQCMCFLVVTRALAPLVHQQADAHSDSNRGSSSRCPDGSSAAATAAAATASRQQHACHLQQQEEEEEEEWLPCCLAARVPHSYVALLDAVGCSREVALWVAHALSLGLDSDYEILALVNGYYTKYVFAWMQRRGLEQPNEQLQRIDFCTEAERQQVLQQYIVPAAKQQQQQGAYQGEPLDLHLWLSVSLLQWAVDMPSSTPCFTLCCWRAAESAARFLSLSTCELAFDQVWLNALTAQQQQQQQRSSPAQTPQQQMDQPASLQQRPAESVQGDPSKSEIQPKQQLGPVATSLLAPDSPQEGTAAAAGLSEHSVTACRAQLADIAEYTDTQQE